MPKNLHDPKPKKARIRYNNEGRREKNKARKARKQARIEEKHRVKKTKRQKERESQNAA